jgi:hypothetical protein
MGRVQGALSSPFLPTYKLYLPLFCFLIAHHQNSRLVLSFLHCNFSVSPSICSMYSTEILDPKDTLINFRRLVLVHGLNGNKMEKWYMIGSTVVACALNVPVYALNQFGYVCLLIASAVSSTISDGMRPTLLAGLATRMIRSAYGGRSGLNLFGSCSLHLARR